MDAKYCWISLVGGTYVERRLVRLRNRDGICLTMIPDGFTIWHDWLHG